MGWFIAPHSGISLAHCQLQHFAGDAQHQAQKTLASVEEEFAAPQVLPWGCLGGFAVPEGVTTCNKLKEVFTLHTHNGTLLCSEVRCCPKIFPYLWPSK